MNRKIFTLLAGAFLMLATVFSVSAQVVHFQNPKDLKLGVPVDKLTEGANDFYHLRVTDIGLNAGQKISTVYPGAHTTYFLDPDMYPFVLYMGKQQADKKYPLFVAELGKAGGDRSTATSNYWNGKGWFDYYQDDPVPKSMESASSLWCTVVTRETDRDIVFDFTNKFAKNQMLEVDISGYESWETLPGRTGTANANDIYHSTGSGDLFTPGGISGWYFSDQFATGVQHNKPLYSYISEDTVAVLCTNIVEIMNGPGLAQLADGCEIFVKIAAVDDVRNGDVPGMLYFTLYEAAPFVLDALDINTMFGYEDWGVQKLTFDPNVNPTTGTNALTNLFSGGIFAEHIALNATGTLGELEFTIPAQYALDHGGLANPIQPIYDMTLVPTGGRLYDINDKPIGADNFASITTIGSAATPAHFDDLGYLYLKQSNSGDGANRYLYAQHGYYSGNAGGDKFLTFNWRPLKKTTGTITDDDLLTDLYLYGQSIWRLVYYPSGDSIYINPFQATYLPTWDAEMVKTSPDITTPASDAALSMAGFGNKAISWISDIAQSSTFYTFRATDTHLESQPSTIPADMMDARLRYGKASYAGLLDRPDFYTYYHHNYVTIQNLTGNVRIVTLGNGSIEADHTIDTHIYFKVYEPCSQATKSDRETIPSDLYLIRSNDGNYYLRIPLHSGDDKPEWWIPEPDERPDLTPSYQWAILKRYENSVNSQIVIYNREFDGTTFTVQLYNTGMNSFDIVSGGGTWNTKAINHKTTNFIDAEKNKNTFIALPKSIKEIKTLGYECVSRDDALVNVYALNFSHEYDQNRYVDWKGDYWKYPNTDTTVYVQAQGVADHRVFFKLDTAYLYGKMDPYGFKPADHTVKIKDLVQLERQPYYLNLEDPYKLLCRDLYSFVNGTQQEYAIGRNERVLQSFLGKPIFNLRHTYFKTGADGEPIPYFALVQRLNKVQIDQYVSDPLSFEEFLRKNFTTRIVTEMMAVLNVNRGHTNNSYWQTGIFVAGVDNQTTKLKFMPRIDVSTTLSTFALVKDDDPIYRRFNSVVDDGAEPGNEDAPKYLKFYWMDRPSYEMFENTGFFAGQKAYWENYGIGTVKTEGKKNYLGYVNTNQYPDAATSIFVDTAFINRGTGPVKPQYLLLVDPKYPKSWEVCDDDGNIKIETEGYLWGRYLINATDSARGVGSGVTNTSINASYPFHLAGTNPYVDKYNNPIGKSYLWENNWERLVFTEAVHSYVEDALYLVEGIDLTPFFYQNNPEVLDISKLDKASTTEAFNKDSVHLYIRKIDLSNNDHKDAVFQMRLIERKAKQFIIESETGTPDNRTNLGTATNPIWRNDNRIWGTSYGQLNSEGPMIAPCAGAWIKEQGGTAIVSRSDMIENLANGLRMDVRATEEFPTGNEVAVAAAPTVLGGYNAVTILGAAGKKVVVTNVLGQTVAGAVLTSDNATIAAPKGIVVVTIDGKAAVKTLVK